MTIRILVRYAALVTAMALLSILLVNTQATIASGNDPHLVGKGTAASCNDAALSAAVELGGAITFNCGARPVIIHVHDPMPISIETTVDGNNLVTLDGDARSNFFNVSYWKGVKFTVKNLTFINGRSHREGGAIHAHYKSELVVIHCTFVNNVSTSQQKQFDGGGGAIFVGSEAKATISNSTFISNVGANGGAIYSLNSRLSVTGSTFTNNIANFTSPKSGSGGAIWNDTGELAISKSVFTGNVALYQGGALAVSPDNRHPTGKFVVSDSSFINNSSYYGNFGSGGAIFSQQPLLLLRTTLAGNKSRNGGALWIGADATLANVTISGNRAVSPDGQHGMGGGLNVTTGKVSLTNVTIANNYADFLGGGIFGTIKSKVKNSIIANNVAHNGGHKWGIQNQCSQQQLDGGENLIFPLNDCGFGTSELKDPKIAPLANNGGSVETIALFAESPAINTGDRMACARAPVSGVDERGKGRLSRGRCDIGAFEGAVSSLKHSAPNLPNAADSTVAPTFVPPSN